MYYIDMGPVLIFDKSALQCFGIEESVWLDSFFIANIIPIFYIETLADLSLPSPSKPAVKIISEIAAKVPKALPNVHHSRLILGNLLGKPVETGHGRPIVERGATKRSPDGKIGVHFEESQEAKALARWHRKEYLRIEHEFARQWRVSLDALSFDAGIGIVRNIVPGGQDLSTLANVKAFIDNFINGDSRELIYLALDFLGINDRYRGKIIDRWDNEGNPSLVTFAPYAAYVFSIDLLFYLAASKGLIAKERPTNKIDLAYLYYLPFCHIFTSGDKLHAKTVPLFMRPDQSFIPALELKEALNQINTYYLQFQDEIDEVGVMQYATFPPLDIQTSLHQLWDTHCPSWRESAKKRTSQQHSNSKSDSALLKHLRRVREESVTIDPATLETMDDADHVIINQSILKQRGRWRMMPKGVGDK